MQLVKDHTKAVIFMGEAADRFEVAAKEAGVRPIYRASSIKMLLNRVINWLTKVILYYHQLVQV